MLPTNEVPLEVKHTAYNHLTFLVSGLAVRARTCTAPVRDTFGGQLPDIDTDVLHQARAKLSCDDMIIANYIATGCVWGQHNKHNASDDVDHHCPHCGAPNQDLFTLFVIVLLCSPLGTNILQKTLAALTSVNYLNPSSLASLPPSACFFLAVFLAADNLILSICSNV